MENKEKISRRDALKRMSKTAITVAITSMFPSVNALADTKYTNYDNYSNYGNYSDYTNYNNYQNYCNYQNYSDYNDCH